MKSCVKILLTALLLVWLGHKGGDAPRVAMADAHHGTATTLLDRDSHGSEALISDSSQLLHLCGPRPSRLANGNAAGKRSIQRPDLYSHHSQRTLRHYGKRPSHLSAPISPLPQSDRYVFALRRLLC